MQRLTVFNRAMLLHGRVMPAYGVCLSVRCPTKGQIRRTFYLSGTRKPEPQRLGGIVNMSRPRTKSEMRKLKYFQLLS